MCTKIECVSIFEALGKDRYNILQYHNTTQQNCENLIQSEKDNIQGNQWKIRIITQNHTDRLKKKCKKMQL